MTGYLFENDGLEADFWFFSTRRAIARKTRSDGLPVIGGVARRSPSKHQPTCARRIGHVAALAVDPITNRRWRQVDFAAGEVRIDEPPSTKNEQARVFRFTQDLRGTLENQRKLTQGLDSPCVFCQPVAERVTKARSRSPTRRTTPRIYCCGPTNRRHQGRSKLFVTHASTVSDAVP